LRAGKAVDADGEFTVQAAADLFVAVAGRGTRQRRAVEDFFVRPAHGFSFELKLESCKFSTTKPACKFRAGCRRNADKSGQASGRTRKAPDNRQRAVCIQDDLAIVDAGNFLDAIPFHQ